jgi:chromosome partitioning protein
MNLEKSNDRTAVGPERAERMALTLAIVNPKGGVGKTTTAVNLSAALAATNRRILLVDLDSQGAASTSLGAAERERTPTIGDVLGQGAQVLDSIKPTRVDNLDLLQGGESQARSDYRLGSLASREGLIDSALRPIRNNYDFFIIDCPPSLSLMSINALAAADAVIVPVVPHSMALGGLKKFREIISDNAKIRQRFGVESDLLGILLTQVDTRIRPTPEIIDKIRFLYKELVFETIIEMNTKVAEAPAYGKTILDFDGNSPVAESYRNLARETLERCSIYSSKS